MNTLFRPLLGLLALTSFVSAQAPATIAGPTETGYLLPNGWHLTPVGKHFVTTDLPLNLIPLADNKHVLVATSGYNKHNLYLVDITGEATEPAAAATCRQSWYGLTMNRTQDKVWWSGGGHGNLHTFNLADGILTRTSPTEAMADAAAKAEKAAKESTPD